MPPLYPVTITLTQENVPLEGAFVDLVPADAANAWGAGGKTDAKGEAILYARPDFKGAAAGKYKVVITKKESKRGGTSVADNATIPTETEDGRPIVYRAGDGGPITMEEWTYVDRQYITAATTPLEIEVTNKGSNQSFDLGKQVYLRYRVDGRFVD